MRAGVACEPANHEFLSLALRNIEEMQMRDPGRVRARIDEPLIQSCCFLDGCIPAEARQARAEVLIPA